MASTQQLLYLPEQNEASACLEVLRRLLQPESKSLPHITLRYSTKPLKEAAEALYEDLHVSDFILDQVTSFDGTRNGRGIRTIVLLCDSEELEHVAYRPAFPQSVFHLTLYDGAESLLAERGLEVLGNLTWGLRFEMDLERFPNSKAASVRSTLLFRDDGWFTNLAHRVYRDATAALALPSSLTELDQDQRLALIMHVSARLHSSPGVSASDHVSARDYLRLAPFQETRQLAFWSEEDISSLSPGTAGRRNDELQRLSTFITPPELSLDVVDETLRWLEPEEMVDFGDPAIGGGIFYAAVRHRIGDDRLNSARGVEIDPISARRTLHRWRRARLSVLVGDFIEQVPELMTWTLVFANPPYRRSQLIGNSLNSIRTRLESDLGLDISRRSDLYLYFVLRAHAWMSVGAIAAWVIPAEFQVTDYGGALRQYLATRVQLLRVHTYDPSESQFDNALISTAVVIFRNVEPTAKADVKITEGGTLRNPNLERLETAETLRKSGRWSFAYLASRSDRSDLDRHLGDYFTIKRGIATGANSLFILTSAQVNQLEVRASWIRPLFPRAKEIPGGVLQADDEGLPSPASDLWLIDTNESIPDIEMKSERFAAYLRSIDQAAKESVLARRRHPVYSQEARPIPLFAFVYMAKLDVAPQRRFIANYSRATILNNYLGMYPKPFLESKVAENRSLLKEMHHSLSGISIDELKAQGRTYGLGLLKLEPKELSRVKLPTDAVWQTVDS